MRDARSFLFPLLALSWTAGFAAPAAASGAWTTYQRAEQYTSLIARGDTIWCASSEAALQRFARSADTFEVITREPGKLASHALTALEFDRSGRLWIGTEDAGVSRLSADGTSWDLVSTLDGLPAGAVTVLRAVGDTLLIGTENGIALWDGDEITGTVPEGVNPSPLPSDVITGLVLSGDSLWAATEKGLYVSRASTGLSTWDLADAVFSGVNVTALGWDGTTLMAAAGGVARILDRASGTWSARGGIGTVLGLSDHGGTIVASSLLGIHRWDGTGWTTLTGGPLSADCVPSESPYCVGVAATAVDEAGRVWAASRDGLHEYADASWTLHTIESLPGNDVQNIVTQGSRVYVATYNEGVGRFDGAQWRNWFVSTCTSGCDTTFLNPAYAFALLVDQAGRKWVGNWAYAIESLDDSVDPPSFTHYQVGQGTYTDGWSAAADSSGGRWVGMDCPGCDEAEGIEYYDSSGVYKANYTPENTTYLRSGFVRALAVDDGHANLWVGCKGNGVVVFDLPDTAGGPLELRSGGALDEISTLDIFGVVIHSDSAWVMSTSDLRCFSTATLAQWGTTKSITGSPAGRGACHPLDVGPDGTAWVGTDGGLRSYAMDGTETEYTTANSQLAGDEVRAVWVDKATGVVWAGTAVGLSRFDPSYVAPPAAALPSLEVRVYPNPAVLTGAGLFLRLTGNGTSYAGTIYDIGGRRLHRFTCGDGDVFWNGRDESGGIVHPGVYFVRVESGGAARTVRAVLLR